MRLIRFLPLLFTRFRKEAVMFWRVMRHPQTPAKAKVAALLAVLYVVSPIDLIPDVIPVLGWLDDVGMVTLLLSIAYKLLPRDLYEALRAKTYGADAGPAQAEGAPPGKNAGAKSWSAKREPQIIDVTPER
jgi:uncharacterized membrane protein YkvA (DUF1232 family)